MSSPGTEDPLCGTCLRRDEMKSAHPGFKAVQSGIASKMGVSKERAGAILASRTRNASASAKKANPRLNRVKG